MFYSICSLYGETLKQGLKNEVTGLSIHLYDYMPTCKFIFLKYIEVFSN